MRYATIPAWTYVMLIVMGVGFICGAVPFWLFVPVSGHAVAVIWVLMGLGFVVFSMRALAGRRDDDRIRRQGIRATATLLSANYTGMTVNNVPQFALHLRIDGNGPSYETKIKLLTFNPPSDGSTMSVRVDPQRRQHVVLADDTDDAASNGTTVSAASSTAPTITAGDGSQIAALVAEALRRAQSGAPGSSMVVNPDGSRTITSTTVEAGGAPPAAADTVRLLGQLDKLHSSGAIDDAEFDSLKRKLLGEP